MFLIAESITQLASFSGRMGFSHASYPFPSPTYKAGGYILNDLCQVQFQCCRSRMSSQITVDKKVLRLQPDSHQLLTPLFRQQLINLLMRNPILAKKKRFTEKMLHGPVHYPAGQDSMAPGLDYCLPLWSHPMKA